jgi:GGDEF domain-containing protein
MEALAQRLLAEVRADGRLRVSAGWAVCEHGSDRLLLRADRALAEAKRAGKDRALAYA